jgi:hypothetical protein
LVGTGFETALRMTSVSSSQANKQNANDRARAYTPKSSPKDPKTGSKSKADSSREASKAPANGESAGGLFFPVGLLTAGLQLMEKKRHMRAFFGLAASQNFDALSLTVQEAVLSTLVKSRGNDRLPPALKHLVKNQNFAKLPEKTQLHLLGLERKGRSDTAEHDLPRLIGSRGFLRMESSVQKHALDLWSEGGTPDGVGDALRRFVSRSSFQRLGAEHQVNALNVHFAAPATVRASGSVRTLYQSVDYGNVPLALGAMARAYKSLNLSTGRDGLRSVGDSAFGLRKAHDDDDYFLKAFDKSVSDVERQVKKGKISEKQGQAILFELFSGFAKASRYEFGRSSPSDKITHMYEASHLSAPFRARDTDGDGKRDIDELARGGDIYKSERIWAGAGHRVVEARKTELEDAISDPKRTNPKKGEGTHQTYIGDQGTRYGKKTDGYIHFTPKKLGDQLVPDRLVLGGRRIIKNEAMANEYGRPKEVLVIRRGQDVLVAVPRGNGKLDFYKRGKASNADFLNVKGQIYEPLNREDPKRLRDLAIAYEHASIAANSGRARVSPQDHNQRVIDFNEARRPETEALVKKLDADTSAAMKKHQKSIADAKTDFQDWAKIFGSEYQVIAGAVAQGFVDIELGEDGSVKLQIARGRLSRSEVAKLERKFGDNIRVFEKEINDSGHRIHAAKDKREAAATAYYKYVNAENFQEYLKGLPPEQAAEKVAEVAETLSGTKAGQRFADDLWNAAYVRGRSKHNLAELVMRDIPRTDRTMGHLSVVAQAASGARAWQMTDASAHFFYLHIVNGKEPSADEKALVQSMLKEGEKLAKADLSPAQQHSRFEKVVKDLVTKHPGPASHVFHSYGHAYEHAIENAGKGKGKMPRLGRTGHKGVMFGAAAFATVSFGLSISHLMHDQSVENMVHVGVEGINAGVMWAGVAESFFSSLWAAS